MQEPAFVHFLVPLAIAEICEDTAADVGLLQARPFLPLQLEGTCHGSRIHTLYQTESHGAPKLAADNVDAVEAQFGNLEELAQRQPVHLPVPVTVQLAAAAADHSLDESAHFNAVLEDDLVFGLVLHVLADIAVVTLVELVLHVLRGGEGRVADRDGNVVVEASLDVGNLLLLRILARLEKDAAGQVEPPLHDKAAKEGGFHFHGKGVYPLLGTDKPRRASLVKLPHLVEIPEILPLLRAKQTAVIHELTVRTSIRCGKLSYPDVEIIRARVGCFGHILPVLVLSDDGRDAAVNIVGIDGKDDERRTLRAAQTGIDIMPCVVDKFGTVAPQCPAFIVAVGSIIYGAGDMSHDDRTGNEADGHTLRVAQVIFGKRQGTFVDVVYNAVLNVYHRLVQFLVPLQISHNKKR